MSDALLAIPAHVRRRLADALASGTLPVPCSPGAVRSVTGEREGTEVIIAALNEVSAMGVPAVACAAWLRSLESAASRVARADLVWSGPEVPGLHARDTRRVYEELLGTAQRSIWISSYAYFDGPKAFSVLAKRMDAVPELQVTLMLNIQRKQGDTSIANDIVRRFADRFWQKDWPGSRHPQVYYDRRALDLEGPAGVLHAKAVVADDDAVFITSANLTEAAFDRNIEMGLLTRDSTTALGVVSHFRTLIEKQLLSLLPSE